MSSLRFFEVPVSTVANVTTFVTIQAVSVEQASDLAFDHVRAHGGDLGWTMTLSTGLKRIFLPPTVALRYTRRVCCSLFGGCMPDSICDDVARFSRAVVADLNRLARLGVEVPEGAYRRAEDLASMADFTGMRVSACSALLISLECPAAS